VPELVREMARLLQAAPPDVVHAYSSLLKVVARLFPLKARFRLVASYHNVLERHHFVI